jgi:membrane associated rhomboid family serine protease
VAGKLRISYNAPVILTFAALAVIVQLIGKAAVPYVIAWPTFSDWRAYLGLFTHPLGHANWDHLLGNFSVILLVGPILEERHGSKALLSMFLFTALVTGLINTCFTDNGLLGASGIVFMLILLASTANIRQGTIPLTFIAVAILYLGREMMAAFREDNVSQLAHMVGGVVGAIFGFVTAPKWDHKKAIGGPAAPARIASAAAGAGAGAAAAPKAVNLVPPKS